jgi:hypothetical protein
VSPGNGGYSEDIAIKAAAKAYLGDPVPIEVVVQEELDADDRAVARVDRAFELIKEERERVYERRRERRAAAEQWRAEREKNPEATPDPCLLPDRDQLESQIEAKRRKARAKWLCLYAIHVLCFNLPDGFDEEIDWFGTACERIALMSLLARLGYQIVGLDAKKAEITIRRCHDGEWQTSGIAIQFVPAEILQAIEVWGAVRFNVEMGFRPDDTYGVIETNDRATPILKYFPFRFQRPELWSDGTDGAKGPFYDRPREYDDFDWPRRPPFDDFGWPTGPP